MILRFFRATTHDGKSDEFRSLFLGTILPLIRSQEGLMSASIGLPREESPNEFSMVMVWRDVEALRTFAGDHWDRALVLPEEAHLLSETHVHHYELAE